MTTFPPPGGDKVLRIYLALVQYPILSTSIRARMRREIFRRGVITSAAFEAEVRDQAIRSQEREALQNPYSDEPGDVWEIRLTRVRDHLTDFYFAYNLPYELFEEIIRQALAERGVAQPDISISFNPELAPQNMLFEHALMIENTPLPERERFEARLREIKVVLIRTLISDQLAYVNIAKEWLTTSDLMEIRRRKIGGGKIGGKSAGMLLAYRILETVASPEIRQHLHIPESYYLGADITYRFMSQNNLMHWNDQKYKAEEQIRQEYPQIRNDFEAGVFPPDAYERLAELLSQIGLRPLIVRSSSLLEDNFGTSFAGKYESHFCPNQGTPEENLRDLTHAIQMIYASIFNPDVLLYRRRKELQDYDERMAILIQVVEGQRYGDYYLPHAAGVAFSRNLFRWSPQIRREDGFVRLVWGLGTRAVDRVGNDYPRLIALSHPLLHPQGSPGAIQHYSQHFIDMIDLKANKFVTLPVSEVFSMRYPQARYIAQVAEEGSLIPLRSRLLESGKEQIVITFDGLLQRTSFAPRLREMLTLLEKEYRSPVDTEFTVEVPEPHALNPHIEITLLQCRPQSHLKENKTRFPTSLDPRDIIFSTHRVVPEGYIQKIQYVIFVPHETYFSLPSHAARVELARWIGKLNARLAGKVFICLGPGRWGTSNSDLGVPIGYGDIYYTRALIELSGEGIAHAPEPSFGTHFFQDLLESNIYPLAIYLDDQEAIFNHQFFYNAPNCLAEFLPPGIQLAGASLENYLRLINVSDFRARHTLDLVMDDEKNRAVAFLVPDGER
ncbi:MAG: PEP/pyruvate-binding domain-containing protein [Anaerolineales bacterium]|jgi:hypothetical protein|nr:PEP/pyruvate-binding domain-containing protein [Anaerolineales bacterium]